MMSILSLKNKYQGRPAYIVGKGPSLQYLSARDFPDKEAPVLVVNEALLVVQELGVPNPLLSMQKDGCDGWNTGNICQSVCEMHVPMLYPKDEKVTVILQRPGYSQACLPDWQNKVYMTPVDDLEGVEFSSEMSIVLCVEIARQILGCSEVTLFCLDSLREVFSTWGGQTDEQLARNRGYYAYALRRLNRIFDAHKYPHSFVFPEPQNA